MLKKYHNRLNYLLTEVTKCCGQLEDTSCICPHCNIRIQKCVRLVKKWQIPLVDYIKLVRAVYKEFKRNNYEQEF